ncbi:UDP-glucose:glucosyltransferase [Medicago truncatula]|uniref:UDP-glucose:glucosyltransferase n=1 Tax=Medicago truncatula TaxID=3880 RepID=G7LAZ7_MEDTR|nr:UDP-glucose:glucosyltransferase [Medicago truncatula]
MEKFVKESDVDAQQKIMATGSAAKFGIPRIVFHAAAGFFSLCASQFLEQYEPFKNVSSETEEFVIPNLPGNIKMTRLQLESEVRSYGIIVNSFYELDGAYADYYREVLGQNEWDIGPFSVFNRDMDTSYRGKEPSINKHECLKCTNHFLNSQIKEIDMGLKRRYREKGLPEFEKRMKGNGLIIRGWSPQLLILQHNYKGLI